MSGIRNRRFEESSDLYLRDLRECEEIMQREREREVKDLSGGGRAIVYIQAFTRRRGGLDTATPLVLLFFLTPISFGVFSSSKTNIPLKIDINFLVYLT